MEKVNSQNFSIVLNKGWKVLIVLPPNFFVDVPDVEKVNSQIFPIVLTAFLDLG